MLNTTLNIKLRLVLILFDTLTIIDIICDCKFLFNRCLQSINSDVCLLSLMYRKTIYSFTMKRWVVVLTVSERGSVAAWRALGLDQGEGGSSLPNSYCLLSVSWCKLNLLKIAGIVDFGYCCMNLMTVKFYSFKNCVLLTLMGYKRKM